MRRCTGGCADSGVDGGGLKKGGDGGEKEHHRFFCF